MRCRLPFFALPIEKEEITLYDFNGQIIDEFRANRGRVGGMFEGTRLVLLTTKGARSGRPHTVPLGYLPDDGGRMLVIGSAAGAPTHPAWYHNVLANPRVTVETGVFTIEADAEVLKGEERDRVFARAVEADPGWSEYQAKTDRVLPVVALRPVSGAFPDLPEGDVLVLLHDVFRRELALVRNEVADSGTGIGAQLRINCLTLCGGLHHHHGAESGELFPYLRDHHPELDEVLDRLDDDHGALRRLLDELQQLVTSGATDPVDLLAEVDRLVADVEAHLAREERYLVPILNALPPREEDRLTVTRLPGASDAGAVMRERLRSLGLVPPAGVAPGQWVNATKRSVGEAGVTVYVHGGGFERTSPELERALAYQLSQATDRPVFAVTQRLAPAHPYPAALDDVLAVYGGLLDAGVPASGIVLFGESSGGTLVLSTLLALVEAGSPLPAGAVAVSPVTDLTLANLSLEAGEDDLISQPVLEHVRDQYLAGAPPDQAPQSPLHGNLAGLPRLLLAVGAAEVLLDDSRRFAAAAARAGVPVDLDVYEDMPHGFHLSALAETPPPEATAFLDRLARWTNGGAR